MVMLIVLAGFVLVAVGAMVVWLFKDANLADILPIYSPDEKKKVKSSYWGCYNGADTGKGIDQAAIQLPKITFEEVVIVGSSVYAKGKAVKSLRK